MTPQAAIDRLALDGEDRHKQVIQRIVEIAPAQANYPASYEQWRGLFERSILSYTAVDAALTVLFPDEHDPRPELAWRRDFG